MNCINQHIIKTFEHLHNKNPSIEQPSPKSRVLYRINQEKLDQYRSRNNSKYRNANKEKHLIPIIKISSDKIIHRKSVSTQTSLNNEIDLTQSSLKTLSITSKNTSKLDLSSVLSSTTSSSSLSNTNKAITMSISLSDSEISINTDTNPIKEYQSPPTNCRIYIRSIVEHMLSDNLSDED